MLGGGGGGAGGGIPLPSGGLGGVEQGQSADNAQIAQACQTGASANRQLDCEVVAVDNSLDGYWSDAFARSGQSFQKPRTQLLRRRGEHRVRQRDVRRRAVLLPRPTPRSTST